MTQDLIERTTREWVFNNPARGARDLERLASAPAAGRSADEIVEALIKLAGRLHVAESRAW